MNIQIKECWHNLFSPKKRLYFWNIKEYINYITNDETWKVSCGINLIPLTYESLSNIGEGCFSLSNFSTPPDPDKKSCFNNFYPKAKKDVTIQTDPQCQRGRVFSVPEVGVYECGCPLEIRNKIHQNKQEFKYSAPIHTSWTDLDNA